MEKSMHFFIIMNILDITFARQLAPRLDQSKEMSTSPYKLNFRCPVCGDSHTRKHLTRGWIYEGTTGNTRGVMLFNCFNCNNDGRGAVPLSVFLKERYPDLYKSYLYESFQQERELSGGHAKEPEMYQGSNAMPHIEPKAADKNILDDNEFYCRIDELTDTHPVKRYVMNRRIPKELHHLLGFTLVWKEFSNSIKEGEFSEKSLYYDHPRLVIPIYTKDGLVAFQGRALSSEQTPRYQTIKLDDEFQKIYGLERVDESKMVIYVEGPIDSLFLHNGCAMTGGLISPDIAPYRGNRAWCLDNEPRSKDTVARYKALVDQGEPIVLWDKLSRNLSGYKDINDMIMKGGASPKYINEYIARNICYGLMAKQRLSKWVKI